jgi:hypothetical protein
MARLTTNRRQAWDKKEGVNMVIDDTEYCSIPLPRSPRTTQLAIEPRRAEPPAFITTDTLLDLMGSLAAYLRKAGLS